MSGPITTRRRATYEELCEVPDHKVAEILDGELIVNPRPALRHASASSSLGGHIWGPFQGGRGGPGGWWILDTAFITLAPDWVCEVIPPSTERVDRSRKMPIYAREGVAHLWLLDPIVRTLEVLRLEAGRWVLIATHTDADVVRAEPFEAIEIDLASLWPAPP